MNPHSNCIHAHHAYAIHEAPHASHPQHPGCMCCKACTACTAHDTHAAPTSCTAFPAGTAYISETGLIYIHRVHSMYTACCEHSVQRIQSRHHNPGSYRMHRKATTHTTACTSRIACTAHMVSTACTACIACTARTIHMPHVVPGGKAHFGSRTQPSGPLHHGAIHTMGLHAVAPDSRALTNRGPRAAARLGAQHHAPRSSCLL